MLAGDLGYGNVKLYGADGALVLPSQISVNGREVVHGLALRNRKRPLEIQTDAGRFFVGGGAHDWGRPVENLDFDRFVGTPEMEALLCGAWSTYGLGAGEELELIVGLPMGVLSGDERTVKGNVRRIKRFLSGEHRWSADGQGRALGIGSVAIASQADGTLFDYLLDDAGKMSPAKKAEFKRELGILNVGMNTCDLLVARGGQTIQRFTAGDTRGVRRLLEILGDGMYSLGELDERLRSGDLDTKAALPVWSREVLGFVEDQWGRSFRRFARVVVAGGGAILLREALIRRFGGKIWVADDPVIATARGLYKYALLKESRKRR